MFTDINNNGKITDVINETKMNIRVFAFNMPKSNIYPILLFRIISDLKIYVKNVKNSIMNITTIEKDEPSNLLLLSS